MVIPKVLKWLKISLLERGEGGVWEWLEEEQKEGADKGEDLFQSKFSSVSLYFQSESPQSACLTLNY